MLEALWIIICSLIGAVGGAILIGALLRSRFPFSAASLGG